MKQVIGIAGREEAFWVKLMDYVNEQGLLDAFVCTEEECLEEEIRRRKPALLFREEGFADEVNFGEREVRFLFDKNQTDGIYKYQPANQIYDEMVARLSVRQVSESRSEERNTEIIAVYSPLGRSGKTSFSLAYAKKFSFFYLGMEDYGIKGEYIHSMGEILYHIRNHKDGIAGMIEDYAQIWNGIRMLSSPPFFQDIRQVSFSDYEWFFSSLRQEERYSYIVDLGTGCLPDFEIFSLFDRVYVPVLEGTGEQKKLEQFWNIILEVFGEIDKRFCKIHVPVGDWREADFLSTVIEPDGKGRQLTYLS